MRTYSAQVSGCNFLKCGTTVTGITDWQRGHRKSRWPAASRHSSMRTTGSGNSCCCPTARSPAVAGLADAVIASLSLPFLSRPPPRTLAGRERLSVIAPYQPGAADLLGGEPAGLNELPDP